MVCDSGCVVITGGFAVNVAVIDLLLSSVMVEGFAVPVRSPLQPANCQPGAGTAVRVIFVPDGCEAPGGLAVIVPEPTVAVVRVKKICVNVAVTDLLRSSVMVEGFAVPVRSPLQPANCQPGAGTAVRVIFVPDGCEAPGGLAVIVPVPTVAVVSVKKICVNVAVTDLLRSSVMVEGSAVPVRSPLQPANCQPGAGTAVSVMIVPE